MKRLVSLALFPILLTLSSAAQPPHRGDGMRFVPDVPAQFRDLTERPDVLGFRRGVTPDPSLCRHYQAILRVDRKSDGIPFFLVTRSGNTPEDANEPICFDSDGETRNGHLVVFKMGSRTLRHGERLRSNRLGRQHVDSTRPEPDDIGVKYFIFTGGFWPIIPGRPAPGLVYADLQNEPIPPRAYGHPGGMQIIGNIMAVALEVPRTSGATPNYERAPYETAIMFFDVTDPENPNFINQFIPHNGETFLEHAGSLGITSLANGKYLMVVGGGGGPLYFYRSLGTDLSDRNLRWELVDTAPKPNVPDEHQTLNFVRERDINGPLYLAGARGHIGLTGEDDDRIDLYRVTGYTPNFEPGEAILLTDATYNGQPVSPKVIAPFPSTGGGRLLSLKAASGFYVSPTGELILYAAAHDNRGPSGSIEVGEWRHREVVRGGSPLLLPTATVDAEYSVDEGATRNVTAIGSAPIVKPFLQLFHGTNYNGFSLIADYEDSELENYFDLFQFEQIGDSHHADKAQSWNWYAPAGCSIRASDRSSSGEIDEYKTLSGADAVRRSANLANVMHDGGTSDINREIDRIEFLNNCSNYYSSPFNLSWDLNRDGTFETNGNTVVFNSSNIDGPSVIYLPVRARSSTGGAFGLPVNAEVVIRNVPPAINQLYLVDARNNLVGSDVPFVLTNRQVTFVASFTDPGRLDHQTASLVWGNGFFDSDTTFNHFNEAFGDGMGAVLHRRSIPNAGTFTPTLTVRDDDGGSGARSAPLRVLTPEQAVSEILLMLNIRITQTTNISIRRDLERARDALGTSGALREIRRCQYPAARTFLNQAIGHLDAARTKGASVATLLDLVRETSAALPVICVGDNA